jgi:hypothetical protein
VSFGIWLIPSNQGAPETALLQISEGGAHAEDDEEAREPEFRACFDY